MFRFVARQSHRVNLVGINCKVCLNAFLIMSVPSWDDVRAVVGEIPEDPQSMFDVQHLRSVEEIAQRAMCLFCTATYADVLLQKNCTRDEAFAFANKCVVRYEARELFTENEKRFFDDESPSDELVGKHCWDWEPLNFILWCLGFKPEIGLPNQPCSVPTCARAFARNRFRKNFVESSRVVDTVEDMFKVLSVCLDAKNQSKFECGVLDGWRKAAKWMTSDANWDEINQ